MAVNPERPTLASDRDANGSAQSPMPRAPDDYEEISLVDIVRVLHRRRLVLAVTVALALVAGGALTVFATPQYESAATVIPLTHEDIIRQWLDSRQSAELVVDAVGAPLYATLYPEQWDASSETWRVTDPGRAEIARKLQDHVSVSMSSGRQSGGSEITVTASFADASLARDVAAAYVASLDELRPRLERIEANQLFEKYYDGTNEQEARRNAETTAAQREYWIVFDEPVVPDSPVSPRPALNMALSLVLGVMGGVMLVFALEWLRQYRAEFQRVDPPL